MDYLDQRMLLSVRNYMIVRIFFISPEKHHYSKYSKYKNVDFTRNLAWGARADYVESRLKIGCFGSQLYI